jgi:homospermidine synthase
MSDHQVHVNFSGRIVFVGFGSIGQGVLPLMMRHIGTSADRITIVSADERGLEEARHFGVKFITQPVKPENLRTLLEPLVGQGDFLLNLSVDVSSIALVQFCQERGALYLDTCIEPWPGGYTDQSVPASRRTNYALREAALALRDGREGGPTAVLTHGANPGLVSHLVKKALLDVAAATGVKTDEPSSREDWAALAKKLDVKVIHVAERDTQVSPVRKRVDEFVNTWSVDGFVSEGCQPCELGWGSHERHFPTDGNRYDFGRGSSIFLSRPGAATRVRTWTPKAGHFHAFAITHGESISISDYLTVKENGVVSYRPTVHYSYHPCDDAVLSVHEFVGRNYVMQSKQRILMDEISSGGIDELGVLLAGHAKNAYWYGSQLSVDEARQLCPFNNATSLQVCVSVLSGVIWAMENPQRGIVEPDDMDYRRNLEICMPYLGPVVGEFTEWNPLTGRESLFSEDLDHEDPWQFKNVRVV